MTPIHSAGEIGRGELLDRDRPTAPGSTPDPS